MTMIPSAASSRRLGLGQAEGSPASVAAAGVAAALAPLLAAVPWGISELLPIMGEVALGAIMSVAANIRCLTVKNA
ncbi:MAG: hypothetical protein JWP04_3582 [Belnapia sp.]|nr:hypothetical protein [Belnapia sp.]